MIIQLFSKDTREICQVLSLFYKYLVSMIERYVMYCHDFTNI
jgi:hypothetical protein